MRDGSRVWAAVSGGADSAVATARLVDAGAQVTGVTMRLVDPNVSESHDAALAAARSVCDALSIRHRVVDVRGAFQSSVIEKIRVLSGTGATPNPCVICNEHVKFGVLLEEALVSWADVLATGHYARVSAGEDGVSRIARPADTTKDQSYFLYRIPPETLAYVEFPLADSLKDAVLDEAASRNLPILSAESQDICVPELVPLDKGVPGPIIDTRGTEVGEHDGVLRFTVGQRKGLGLAGGPYFVTSVDAESGTVRVGSREDVLRTHVLAVEPVWTLATSATECRAQIRYRGEAVPAVARISDDGLEVEFADAVEGPAPGQAVVCYVEDAVVGGGVIARTW